MSVYDSLTTQLKTVTTLPPFAEQNEVYQPGRNSWCRATLLPSEPYPGSIGLGGFDWENGLYQVDVFTPLNAPINTALLDAIVAVFPGALKLTVTGYDHDLEVLRCWVSATRQDKSWHISSLSVRWRVPRNLGT